MFKLSTLMLKIKKFYNFGPHFEHNDFTPFLKLSNFLVPYLGLYSPKFSLLPGEH